MNPFWRTTREATANAATLAPAHAPPATSQRLGASGARPPRGLGGRGAFVPGDEGALDEGQGGDVKQLPLLTIVVLTAMILAWNFSFYGDFYRAQAVGRSVPAEARPPQASEVELVAAGGVGSAEVAGRGKPAHAQQGAVAEPGASLDHRVTAGSPEEDGDVAVTYTYQGGAPKSEGTLRHGYRYGEWREYWENGNLLMTGRYEESGRVGDWEFFHEDGSPSSRTAYVMGMKDGESESFFSNGKLASRGHYSADQRTETWTQYYRDGSIKETGTYEQGVRQGEWTFRDPEGFDGPRTGQYRDGVRVPD